MALSNRTEGLSYTFRGNIFSLLSAILYGLYAIILKKRVTTDNDEIFNLSYFLGFVGLLNAVFLVPVFHVLNHLGYETFEWPNKKALKSILVNYLLRAIISDFCWAKSVLLIDQLYTTFGIAFTISITI